MKKAIVIASAVIAALFIAYRIIQLITTAYNYEACHPHDLLRHPI
jgi:hypothetical protein